MEGKKRKKLDILMVFFIAVIYMEIVVKIFCCPRILDMGLVYIALFSFGIALILKGICSLWKKKVNKILAGLILIILFLIYSAQAVYQRFFGKFFVLYSVAAGGIGQITGEGMAGSTVSAIISAIPVILLLSVPLFFYFIFERKYVRARKQNGWHKAVFPIVGLAVYMSVMLLVSTLPSTKSAYRGTFDADLAVQKFGLLNMEVLDFGYNILGVEQEIELVSTGEIVSEEPEEIIYEPNIMDIDFDALLASETDENVKVLHQFFASEEPTYQNEYTGMFEGYNLITITAEGFYPYAIDEELTPTLYKMMNEGFQFTNFYTPIWGVSTSDGEYVGCTGLLPKSGVWSFYKSGSISMPFCLGNQFEKLGVNIRKAYHNHTYDYYERDISHPNMGYDYKGLYGGLTTEQIAPTWPESDLQMIEATADEFVTNEEQFLGYYMTVSGHLEYNKGGNYIANKNWSLVEHLECSDKLKAYYACNIELDRAMEVLLQKLETAGVAEKTVIAISADHYPYGLESDSGDKYQYFNELVGHTVETNFELYKGIFILYNPGMEEPIVIDKYSSSVDILPTISNLFNLEYDSRLLMGKDILSDEEPLVIFVNRSWITDKGRYNANTQTFEVFDEESFSSEEEKTAYVQKINNVVANRFQVSAMILETDYYSKTIK